MNGLDIVLAFLSVICFGAAFFIASRPISKAKSTNHQPTWDVVNSRTEQTIDVLSPYNEETQ